MSPRWHASFVQAGGTTVERRHRVVDGRIRAAAVAAARVRVRYKRDRSALRWGVRGRSKQAGGPW